MYPKQIPSFKILPPAEFEAQYVNRHHEHSINAMVVCGPQMEFFFVSSNWPGAVNDSRVLRNSSLYEAFENGFRPFPNAILLGDAIYPRKDWLLPNMPAAPNDLRDLYR